MTIPLPVLQFAMIDRMDGGITPANPIAWRETADEWIIVYEDGRKLRHSKDEPHRVPVQSHIEGAPETQTTKHRAVRKSTKKERAD